MVDTINGYDQYQKAHNLIKRINKNLKENLYDKSITHAIMLCNKSTQHLFNTRLEHNPDDNVIIVHNDIKTLHASIENLRLTPHEDRHLDKIVLYIDINIDPNEDDELYSQDGIIRYLISLDFANVYIAVNSLKTNFDLYHDLIKNHKSPIIACMVAG